MWVLSWADYNDKRDGMHSNNDHCYYYYYYYWGLCPGVIITAPLKAVDSCRRRSV